MDKTLTVVEVGKTAFPKHSGVRYSPFGYMTNRDTNDMCPYCKNENTEVIQGADLNVFNEFYTEKGFKFRAISCCCGAQFSYYWPEVNKLEDK